VAWLTGFAVAGSVAVMAPIRPYPDAARLPSFPELLRLERAAEYELDYPHSPAERIELERARAASRCAKMLALESPDPEDAREAAAIRQNLERHNREVWRFVTGAQPPNWLDDVLEAPPVDFAAVRWYFRTQLAMGRAARQLTDEESESYQTLHFLIQNTRPWAAACLDVLTTATDAFEARAWRN
jgi:hypothetical protein